MHKELTFQVDGDIWEKFKIATTLNNESETTAIETAMKWYIANTFEKTSQTYKPTQNTRPNHNSDSYFHGKANARIPIWALKPSQYNHKIIRAYFTAKAIDDIVTLNMMKQLCSERDHPELFVPTFAGNYAQMKIDGPKSHGKVFEDDGIHVSIWKEIESTLMQHKSSFYSEV